MTHKNNKGEMTGAILITGLMLLINIPTILPTLVDNALEVILFGMLVALAFLLIKQGKSVFGWIVIVLAVIYNPVSSLLLGVEVHQAIDLIAAVGLFVGALFTERSESKI
jgi:hypothetical protein